MTVTDTSCGRYVDVARVTDGETARLTRPYDVRVTPSALVGDGWP